MHMNSTRLFCQISAGTKVLHGIKRRCRIQTEPIYKPIYKPIYNFHPLKKKYTGHTGKMYTDPDHDKRVTEEELMNKIRMTMTRGNIIRSFSVK